MKNLRKFRILLAVLFMVSAVAYAVLPSPAPEYARIAPGSQIVPSLIASSMGATIVWIVVTLLLGRVYCASFCPIGIVQDAVVWLRNHTPFRRRFRYKPLRKVRYHIAVIYVVCLVVGLFAVPTLIEPWHIFCNLATAVNPTSAAASVMRLGIGLTTGIIGGIAGMVVVVVWAWFGGRDFCNVFCPIGTLLSLAEPRAVMHIEINPDLCIGCLKCEDVCSSSCIKVTERRVDNRRCVRCFDCLDVCPNDAIRYQPDNNRAATPMLDVNKK